MIGFENPGDGARWFVENYNSWNSELEWDEDPSVYFNS